MIAFVLVVVIALFALAASWLYTLDDPSADTDTDTSWDGVSSHNMGGPPP